MVHRTTDLFFVLKFKHRVFCGRFTRESHDTCHATPATSTREPTHPRVSACSKNIKIVSYHRVRGCRAYGLLPLWLLFQIYFFSNQFINSCKYNRPVGRGCDGCVRTPPPPRPGALEVRLLRKRNYQDK